MIDKHTFISSDAQTVKLEQIYQVEVRIWPTNVVVGRGNRLALQISSSDTHTGDLFFHNEKEDRAESKFKSYNHLHIGASHPASLRLPIIPVRA